jgi:uncharacterized protein YdaU (DUF1376 family)
VSDNESRTGVPWFPFYPRDFASDSNVEAMTPAEVGCYMLLLCKAWFEDPPGTLPNDEAKLRKWSRAGGSWKHYRGGVLSAFTLKEDGRFHQKRMVQEAENQALRHNKRVQAGQKGGIAKSSNATAMLQQSPSSHSHIHSHTQHQDRAHAHTRGNGSQKARVVEGGDFVSEKNGDGWKPPTLQVVKDYALYKGWTLSHAKDCWEKWNARKWKHYGVQISEDSQWQAFMKEELGTD